MFILINRMSKIYYLFFFCLSVLKVQGQNDSLDIHLLSLLDEGTEIRIAIYENGEIEKFAFTVEKDNLRRKEVANDLFEIGSITKVYTTLSSLLILQKHEIDIHSPIIKFFPPHRQNISNQITFHQLMTHTSGMPKMANNFVWAALRDPGDPFLHYKEKNLMRYLNGFSALEPRDFQYSNVGMGLLGYLSSHIEKQSLAHIVKSEIFLELNMNSSSLGLSETQYPLVANTRGLRKKPNNYWEFSDVTSGAGSAYSNIEDMALFLKFLLESKNGSGDLAAMIEEMEKEQISISKSEAMGLGLRIFKEDSKILYHGGITYGYKSLLAYCKEKQKGIVILTNAKGLSRTENTLLKKFCFSYLTR